MSQCYSGDEKKHGLLYERVYHRKTWKILQGTMTDITITFFVFNKFIYFIYFYFWLCWVFVAARGLSLVAARDATLHCGAGASHCHGFSCCRAWGPGARASIDVACGLSSCGSQALERRLSSCGAWA